MFSVCRFWNNTIVRIINTSILGFFLHCFLCGQWLASAWLAGWLARVSCMAEKEGQYSSRYMVLRLPSSSLPSSAIWLAAMFLHKRAENVCVCVHVGCVFGERFFSYCNPRPPRQAVAAGPFIIISREL